MLSGGDTGWRVGVTINLMLSGGDTGWSGGGGGYNHQLFLVGIQGGGWVEPSMLSGGDTRWRGV